MEHSRFALAAAMLAVLMAVPAIGGEGQLSPATPADLRAALEARQGRVVLVNFWATWCRPCLKELPALLALEQEYAPRGFELLAVSLDDPADGEAVVQPFLTKWFPSLRTLIRSSPDMDAMVSVVDPAWNEVLPTSYVLDRTGRVAVLLQGGKSAAEFEAAILPLLAGP
jgi:thiol-disulfide isomerase/thioredoxin